MMVRRFLSAAKTVTGMVRCGLLVLRAFGPRSAAAGGDDDGAGAAAAAAVAGGPGAASCVVLAPGLSGLSGRVDVQALQFRSVIGQVWFLHFSGASSRKREKSGFGSSKSAGIASKALMPTTAPTANTPPSERNKDDTGHTLSCKRAFAPAGSRASCVSRHL